MNPRPFDPGEEASTAHDRLKCVRQNVRLVNFSKCAIPGLFFVYFRSFQTNITFLQQYNVNKCQSSIRRWDSNSRPLERQFPPITTRPVASLL